MSKQKDRKVRKKADIPEGETKEQRFVRVATPRVKKAISQLRLVKQTISGNNYSVSEGQMETIITSLRTEVESLQSAYDSKNKSKKVEDIQINL